MGIFDALQADTPQALDPNNPATVLSPDAVKRRQLLADALMKQGGDTTPIRSPWQAAARVAQGLLGGWDAGRADASEAAGSAQAAKTQAAVLAAALGNDNTPAAPASAAAPGAASDDSAAPATPVASGTAAPGSPEVLSAIQTAAANNGIPLAVAHAMATQESRLNPNAPTGGLFQITQGTAADPGYGLAPFDMSKVNDPKANAEFGMKYLAARNPGIDWNDPAQLTKALNSYNGGGDPNYVANVLRHYDPKGVAALYGGAPATPGTQVASAPIPPPSAAPLVAQGDEADDGATNPVPVGKGLNLPASAGVPVAGATSQPVAPPYAPPAPAAPAAAPAPNAPALAAALRKPQDKAQIAALAGAMSDPWADAGTKQLAGTLLAAKLKGATTGPIVQEPNTKQWGQYDSAGKFSPIASADKETATAAQKDYEYSGTHPGFADYQKNHGAEATKAHVVNGALVDNQGKVLYQSPASIVTPRAVDENGAPIYSQSEKTLGEMLRQGLPVPPGLSRTKEGAALIRGAVDYSSTVGDQDPANEAKMRGQNRANWVGAGSEQRALGTATASNALYGNAAASTIDTALRASAEVPRSQWRPWNQVMQMGQAAFSDPKLAAFAMATNTLINDYAKATTPVGVPTDGQRSHAESLLGTAQSPEVYDAVARMMHKEIANTHRAIQDTKTNLQGGHVGELPPLQTPPPGGASAPPDATPGWRQINGVWIQPAGAN